MSITFHTPASGQYPLFEAEKLTDDELILHIQTTLEHIRSIQIELRIVWKDTSRYAETSLLRTQLSSAALELDLCLRQWDYRQISMR